jgi:hypothetical protein
MNYTACTGLALNEAEHQSRKHAEHTGSVLGVHSLTRVRLTMAAGRVAICRLGQVLAPPSTVSHWLEQYRKLLSCRLVFTGT